MNRLTNIGDLLTQRFRSGDDGAALYASAAVAAANGALASRWSASDAQAISFSRGAITVRVSHSAIAGQIYQQQESLLRTCNESLSKQFPSLRLPATSIVTRVNS